MLDRLFKQQWPYFSPERQEDWDQINKLVKERKERSEVFSLGLVILEAGNLLEGVGGLNLYEDRRKTQLEQFKVRYARLGKVLEKMLISHKYLNQRLTYRQLLYYLEKAGLMNHRLSQFKQVQEAFKFHGIDQKIINKLQEGIKLKDNEIEVLTCKLSTLREEANQNQQKYLTDGVEYLFDSQQIDVLIEFLQDTKIRCSKSINLKLDFSYYIDDKAKLCLIGNELKGHKFIQSLDLDLEAYENEGKVIESEPTVIFNYFKTMSNINFLRLNFEGATFTDQHLFELGDQIQFLFRIRELSLNFNETLLEHRKGVYKLYEALNEMIDLEKLHISMDFTSITDREFLDIVLALKYKRNLSELVLSFMETKISDNEGLKQLGRVLLDLESLKVFDLQMPKTNVTEQGFKYLVKNLKTNIYLEKLALNFGWTQINNDIPLCVLADSLKNMAELKIFDIQMCQTKTSDDFLMALTDSLAKLENLEELSLGFGKTDLQDNQTLIDLGANLKKLAKLKKLSIVLFKTEFEEKGVVELCNCLQALENIEFLQLSFGKMKIKTDQIIAELVDALNAFKCLKHFELYLQHTNVSGKGFQQIVLNACKHKSLEHLTLNFEHTDIYKQDVGVSTLGNTLPDMKNLHTFELYLKGNIGMTPMALIFGIKAIISGLKKNKTIVNIKCKIKSSVLESDNPQLVQIQNDLKELLKQRQSILKL